MQCIITEKQSDQIKIQWNLVNSKSCWLEVYFELSVIWIIGYNIKKCEIAEVFYQFFFLSNISFGCIKETSQGDVSFAHGKHMFNIIDS